MTSSPCPFDESERAPKKPNTCSLVTANLSAGETTTENIADHAVLPDANNRKEHETQARHQTPRLPTMDSGLPRPIAATHFKIYFSLERLKLSLWGEAVAARSTGAAKPLGADWAAASGYAPKEKAVEDKRSQR